MPGRSMRRFDGEVGASVVEGSDRISLGNHEDR